MSRIITELSLEEISICKQPANAEADAAIRKGDDGKQEAEPMATPKTNTEGAVLYKAKDGTEYRSAETAALAKQLDEKDARLEKALKEREDADLAKRAADLEHLPGTTDVHKAMLKALDGIEDEDVRASAHDVLKNAADISGLTKQVGANTREGRIAKQVLNGDAQGRLDKMAEDLAAKDKITKQAAMAKVLKTDEGAKLYAATR